MEQAADTHPKTQNLFQKFPKGPVNNYVTPEGGGGMVIFVMNCYKNVRGVGVTALLLCNRNFFFEIYHFL